LQDLTNGLLCHFIIFEFVPPLFAKITLGSFSPSEQLLDAFKSLVLTFVAVSHFSLYHPCLCFDLQANSYHQIFWKPLSGLAFAGTH
jgi:hypothetical protein